MIPIIVLEVIYGLLICAFGSLYDVHGAIAIVFYTIEALLAAIFFIEMLLLFIFFMRHDKHVLIDVALQGVMIFISLFGIVEEAIVKDQGVLDVITRVSMPLRIVIFFFRVEGVKWKVRRLVDRQRIKLHEADGFFDRKAGI